MNRAVAGWLQDDVHYLLAVEVAHVSEETLVGVVVNLVAVLELPVEAAHGEPGQLRGHRPAGEGAGTLVDIALGVVRDAHREELEQLASPVLVDASVEVLVVVEPVDHGGASGDAQDDVAELAHAVLAERVDHVHDLVPVVDLGDAGGEDPMPEDGHLLLQGSVRVEHPVDPRGVAHAVDGARLPRPGLVAVEVVDVHGILKVG